MNVSDERTKSLWMDVDVAPDVPALSEDEQADVVVVGSGVAGRSAAYELALTGRSVVVLDRGRIGSGMTARTTAHLTPIAKPSTVICLTPRSEYAAVISTVANGLGLACWCSFGTLRGRMSFRYLRSLVFIIAEVVVKNKQAERRG